ncbi:helix-turn-helix domain-containing protein [Saccharopolyspora gregorii]|uniref:helix-turn-helix domain-containing protein n=1 Tax=Saccharopolyspora gregorii TaxID=33914 RepID=UPI0021ABCA3F|nr:PucR family transcriptional regulator ligand-binding domain-containing protein [Saccharopolyspora gregorii]
MSGVRLSELVDDPDLGLTLLTGPADPVVHGVYVTDLLDPSRYLSGGELVVTGLMWRADPADSARFAAALAAAGVAAVAAGTARLGSTPPDLVAACREHGLPLLEVPVAVSFSALSERVLDAHRAAGRGWVSALAAGAGLEEVLERASAELGTGCWVVSGAGAVLAGPAEPPAADDLRPGLAGEGTRAGWSFRPVGGGGEPRIARWFVVSRAGAVPPEALEELATVVALVRSRVDQARRIAGRSAESALRRLLDGTSSASEVAVRLDAAGVPVGEPLRVVQLSVPGGAARAAAVLRELAAATGSPSVVAPLGEAAVAVFAADERRLVGLPARFRGFAELAGPAAGLRAGVSDVAAADGLRSALEEAGHARRLAELAPDSAVVTADALASHRVLLASVPAELRRSYRDKLLGPLLSYDAAHAADLVRTLRVFLECSGSWSRCAALLHVHVNTLRYRIGRVEQITGRELGDLSARVDFHLALQLLDDSPS